MEFFTQGLWGELQQTMCSNTLIGHMTVPLDTSQTEDDAPNPKQIDPELHDPEQLTGKPIQLIDFHLIQSNHYLSEMLRKLSDLIKIPPMITNLLESSVILSKFPQ